MILLGVLGLQLAALAFGVLIVVRRPDDRIALLGAWALATVGVTPSCRRTASAPCGGHLPAALGVLMWAPYISSLAVAAVLFTFFASFPRRMVHSTASGSALWAPMAAGARAAGPRCHAHGLPRRARAGVDDPGASC